MDEIIKTCKHGALLDKFMVKLDKRVQVKKNADLIRDFVRDAKLGKTVTGKQKKKLGNSICYKYAMMLRRLDNFWNKPLDKVTVEDMERFIGALEEGKYQSGKGKPYAAESQLDFKKTVLKFYRWFYKADKPGGDVASYSKLTSWIDTSIEQKEVDALTRVEVKTLAQPMKLRDKLIVWMLFDSGARAQEFLNLKVGDLERKESHYLLRIKHEYSKTKGRTIDLSMAKTVELLDAWLKAHPKREGGELAPNALLVPISYDAMRMRIKEWGQKTLKRTVTPHTMRHSSATYWAAKLNQFQLCYRFGWSFSSKMPERYIDRAGIEANHTHKIERKDRLRDVTKENEELQEEVSQLKANQAKLQADVREMLQMVKQGKIKI